jgi:hypothetical protein
MGIDKNSGKGSRLPKTTTDRPSIIKKEHAKRQIKGELRLPFVLSGIRVFDITSTDTALPCGSGLARESGGPVDIQIEWNTAIADLPAPTVPL